MAISRDKKVGREYGFKPYATKGRYQEVLAATPNKAMEDQKKSRHSELKKPYQELTNGGMPDYQSMEYEWDSLPPMHMDYPDMRLPVPETCDPSWQTEVFWCEAYGCCTDGTTTSITVECSYPIVSGPYLVGETSITTKTSGEEKSVCFNVADCDGIEIHATIQSPKQTNNCGKTWPGQRREMIMYWLNEPSAGCSAGKCSAAQIGFITQSMGVGESQEFTIDGAPSGCKCEIRDPGNLCKPLPGNLYTAPATNPECANNPTLVLVCNDVTVDTLEIGVNAYAESDVAYKAGAKCVDNCHVAYGIVCDSSAAFRYDKNYSCGGTSLGDAKGTISSCDKCNQDPILGNCDNGCHCGPGSGWCSSHSCTVDPVDLRSAAMKTAGCCPGALL